MRGVLDLCLSVLCYEAFGYGCDESIWVLCLMYNMCLGGDEFLERYLVQIIDLIEISKNMRFRFEVFD